MKNAQQTADKSYQIYADIRRHTWRVNCTDTEVWLYNNGTLSTVDIRWKTVTDWIHLARKLSTIMMTFIECTALTADLSDQTSCNIIRYYSTFLRTSFIKRTVNEALECRLLFHPCFRRTEFRRKQCWDSPFGSNLIIFVVLPYVDCSLSVVLLWRKL